MKSFKIFLLSFVFILAGQSVFAQENKSETSPSDSVKTTMIKVKGVTCSHDLKTIGGNVEKLKGISYCKAEKAGPTTQFEVRFNPAVVTEKEIYAAIEATAGCQNPNDRPYKVKQ
jgi:copper chaperone CopZ